MIDAEKHASSIVKECALSRRLLNTKAISIPNHLQTFVFGSNVIRFSAICLRLRNSLGDEPPRVSSLLIKPKQNYLKLSLDAWSFNPTSVSTHTTPLNATYFFLYVKTIQRLCLAWTHAHSRTLKNSTVYAYISSSALVSPSIRSLKYICNTS